MGPAATGFCEPTARRLASGTVRGEEPGLSTDGPVRGVNPEPSGGWPWCLTEYEVAYVREYQVRPMREGSWVGNPEKDRRLDDEAAGVLLNSNTVRNAPSGMPASVFASIAAALALLVIGAGLAAVWIQGQTDTLNERSAEISEELDLSMNWIDTFTEELSEDFIVP